MSQWGGGQKSTKKVSRIIWMAPNASSKNLINLIFFSPQYRISSSFNKATKNVDLKRRGIYIYSLCFKSKLNKMGQTKSNTNKRTFLIHREFWMEKKFLLFFVIICGEDKNVENFSPPLSYQVTKNIKVQILKKWINQKSRPNYQRKVC